MNITGRWIGKYTFGKGYYDSMIGKSDPFEFEIVDNAGSISGSCIDNVVKAVNGNESYIIGTFKNNKIAFKKRYKIHTAVDEFGNQVIMHRISTDGIDYSGKLKKKFFSRRIYFSGSWSITTWIEDDPETHVYKGTWQIFRVE